MKVLVLVLVAKLLVEIPHSVGIRGGDQKRRPPREHRESKQAKIDSERTARLEV